MSSIKNSNVFLTFHMTFFHVLRAVCEHFVFNVEKCPFNDKLIEFSVMGLANAFSMSHRRAKNLK